ncbi:hypothetical protein [Paenibacillus validus]|uniref:hypothetical protein n=1 Tax=Paenibacillus validus TaxID=44253 RepID=UPI003D272E6C
MELDKEMQSVVDLKANLTTSVEVKSRTYFSMQHVSAAAYFARRSGEAENRFVPNMDPFPSDIHHEIRSYVTASIFSSVAFIEATINELLCDAEEYWTGNHHRETFQRCDPNCCINWRMVGKERKQTKVGIAEI